jgi:hypothetical protein
MSTMTGETRSARCASDAAASAPRQSGSSGSYAEALRFLEAKGVPPERTVTAAQPGRAHRALSRTVAYPPERHREIGYLAVRRNLWHRGHSAYCMVLAAETALRMSLSRATAIEFGVWYGAGLKSLCEIADFLHQTLGV